MEAYLRHRLDTPGWLVRWSPALVSAWVVIGICLSAVAAIILWTAFGPGLNLAGPSMTPLSPGAPDLLLPLS